MREGFLRVESDPWLTRPTPAPLQKQPMCTALDVAYEVLCRWAELEILQYQTSAFTNRKVA
jgi:hypothetical protein